MVKTLRFRLFPTRGQRSKLRFILDECRWLYNRVLQTRRDAYEYDGTSLGLYDINPMITGWKGERPSLRSVHSQVLQNVSERVQLAFQNFWRRCRSGERPGYPRFKQDDRYDSFTFPQGGFVLTEADGLRIHGVGAVRIRRHRPLIGNVKRLTIHRDGTGCWFACFQTEVEDQVLPPSHDAIGIDVGLESFATLSNGEVIENPRFFRQDQRRLAKLSRQVSGSPLGTERRSKKRRAQRKVWKTITNRRSDFAHKLSRSIVNRFGIICVEDLRIQQMMDGNFRSINRGIADAAWGQFLSFTSYKAEGAGRVFVEVNPRNTSQICSDCGTMVQKDLGIRIHSCPNCGFTTTRDHNSAINILRRGLTSLARAA